LVIIWGPHAAALTGEAVMDGAYMHKVRIYRANPRGMEGIHRCVKDHVTEPKENPVQVRTMQDLTPGFFKRGPRRILFYEI
jgi:hypothetical protein